MRSSQSAALVDGRPDIRPPSADEREWTLDVPGFGSSRFPRVTLSIDADGTALRAPFLQTFVRPNGTGFNRLILTAWSLRADDLVQAACGIVGRDQTEQQWDEFVGRDVPYHATCTDAGAAPIG